MGEVRFMISEAAKQVHVESHVLRYWEEELHVPVGRSLSLSSDAQKWDIDIIPKMIYNSFAVLKN